MLRSQITDSTLASRVPTVNQELVMKAERVQLMARSAGFSPPERKNSCDVASSSVQEASTSLRRERRAPAVLLQLIIPGRAKNLGYF